MISIRDSAEVQRKPGGIADGFDKSLFLKCGNANLCK